MPAVWHGRLLGLSGDGTPGDALLATQVMAGQGLTVACETAAAALSPARAEAVRSALTTQALATRYVLPFAILCWVFTLCLSSYAARSDVCAGLSIGASAAGLVLSVAFATLVWCGRTRAGLGCCFSLRRELRHNYGIPGTEVQDWCVEGCCGPCALVQEARTVARLKAGAAGG